MLDPALVAAASLQTVFGLAIALPLAYYLLRCLLAAPIPSIRVEVCALGRARSTRCGCLQPRARRPQRGAPRRAPAPARAPIRSGTTSWTTC